MHLGLDVSWTRVETAWAMPGSWVDRHYPDIGLFEDIAPDRRAQIVRGDRPRRMFWGTDITRMTCSWRQCITLFTEELPWLTGPDLELVMGRAFCDWIGWDVAAR